MKKSVNSRPIFAEIELSNNDKIQIVEIRGADMSISSLNFTIRPAEYQKYDMTPFFMKQCCFVNGKKSSSVDYFLSLNINDYSQIMDIMNLSITQFEEFMGKQNKDS